MCVSVARIAPPLITAGLWNFRLKFFIYLARTPRRDFFYILIRAELAWGWVGKCLQAQFLETHISPRVLHRLLWNFDTTLHSNTGMFLYTYIVSGGNSMRQSRQLPLGPVSWNSYISEISSAIALKFWFNVAFEYGIVFVYVHSQWRN